uniref:Uncharacterized protein n=1 Tax=Nelumbo nucifera TaxID=4432 RepID=A0A822YWY0_NELNU|nr:TPA_asm: hypothetical protein HUJ06_006681 [Nelumbo nucifera]
MAIISMLSDVRHCTMIGQCLYREHVVVNRKTKG